MTEDLDKLGRAGQLTEAQMAELMRRDAEMDADPSIELTWEQVCNTLRQLRVIDISDNV